MESNIINISQFSEKIPFFGKVQFVQKYATFWSALSVFFGNYVAWWDIKEQCNFGQLFQ